MTSTRPAVLREARGTAAAALYEEITTGPPARRAATLVGVGGSGKSALLADLADAYRSAGVETRLARSELDLKDLSTFGAVLIDDAHSLPEPAFEHVLRHWDQHDGDLVVAYRPWPVAPGLRRLVSALAEQRPPVVLGPLGPPEVLAYVGRSLRGPVPPAEVDRILHETGGMPWLVNRMVSAMRTTGLTSADVAASVALQVGHELEHLDAGLRDLLLASAVGFDLSGEAVPPVLTRSPAEGDALVSEAVAAGLMLHDGTVVPLVRSALLAVTPAYRVRPLQRALVDTLLAGGHSLNDVARELARTGLRHPHVARALESTADGALAQEPQLASELYEEATAAGADAVATAARRAQSAAQAGDLDRAGAIVEELLGHDNPPDLARAVDVGASVWAQRGMLARAADLYRWAGEERLGASAPLGAVAMLGTGDVEEAERMLAAGARLGSPTSLAVASALMAQGLWESVRGQPTRSLWMLVRASDTLTANGAAVPVPELPAVLAALVALNTGELGVAESVAEDALRGHQGGPASAPRLHLLRGWVAMLRDRPEEARAALREADGDLVPRDEMIRIALEVGLARRTDDAAGLVRGWARAREALLHFPVDLFSLLPLGELLLAGARLHEEQRLEPHLADAWQLLLRLGEPAVWAAPLHWCGVQAAILTGQPDRLAPHARGLVTAAATSSYAAVLATAGRAWVRVLSGDVDVTAVERAATGLAAVGLAWDGARLAGHAAARAPERSDMTRLLACARDLHPSAADARQDDGARTTPTGIPVGVVDETGLSAREKEVARLVLAGKTYREIGETIFISPRTAEHHIARIRRRLGVDTRAEMLTRLRALLGE
ncbi:ATP/maltotriose-dependent transcriptional regulator MalT [Georgenia soli]|uniref:ATP/maltotriose-dependent transcriptional regulator MalT n=1 Tax=Georgenia soli TaxID=638953 RepID=A0A2A9EI33_9MICO|nr:LuxR C-terminal-related transcriptional regulator [Georgenia soli]PFG38737.1 ATP/maltotriose-dependent transcriptional regulator MalT [Georgenia soli]